MAGKLTPPAPVTLPQPKPKYDPVNEAQTRRIIERVLSAISRSTNTIQTVIESSSGGKVSPRLSRFSEQLVVPATVGAGPPAPLSDLLLQSTDTIGFTDLGTGLGTLLVGGIGTAVVRAIDKQKYGVLIPNASDANVLSVLRAHTQAAGDVRGAMVMPNARLAPNVLSTQFPGLAFVSETTIRKIASTDTPGCGTGFGFYACSSALGFSAYTNALNPFIGLIGDGAGGFKFGSILCPRGTGFGVAATYADANAVQPAGLNAPGTAEFNVRIKIVPPIDSSTPAKWYAYLDGTLVATFDQAANWPAGDIADASRDGLGLVCGFKIDSGATAFGLAFRNWRSWWTEDLSSDYASS